MNEISDTGEQLKEIVEDADRSARALVDAAQRDADAIRARASDEARQEIDAARAELKAARATLHDAVDGFADTLEAAFAPLIDKLQAPEPEPAAEAPTPEAAAAPESTEPEEEVDEDDAPAESLPPVAGADPVLDDSDRSALAEALETARPDRSEEAVSEADPSPQEERRASNERARLVALNLALGGATREEVERKLRAEHDISDPEDVLDEVFTQVEKVD